MTPKWLSAKRPSRLSAQSTNARTPDTTSWRKRHQTQLDRSHTRHSSTDYIVSARQRHGLDDPTSTISTDTRTLPSNSTSLVDYTVRPQYHNLENTISSGTPTSKPVLYKTTQQHLRNSNANGESIQRGLEIILKFKNNNMSKFRSNNTDRKSVV